MNGWYAEVMFNGCAVQEQCLPSLLSRVVITHNFDILTHQQHIITPTTRMKFHFHGIIKPAVHEETWTSFHKKYGTKKTSGRPCQAKRSPSRKNITSRSVHNASSHDEYRDYERRLNTRARRASMRDTRQRKTRFNLLYNIRRIFQLNGSHEKNRTR
jgi:hypothetical protein